MSINEWERDEINSLHRRIEALEKSVAALDARTGNMVRLGPSQIILTNQEIAEKGKRLTEAIAAANKEIPPADRSQRTLIGGKPVTDDHREIQADGMQKDYVVLSAEERAKGFVRPVRRSYVHKTCGTLTKMGLDLAETYARDPGFYNGTFCAMCRAHFPLDQFVWDGTEEIVGS